MCKGLQVREAWLPGGTESSSEQLEDGGRERGGSQA